MKTFNFKLYDFQKRGVAYALKHHYLINADAMGYGKTIQALSLAYECRAKKVLVVCPAFLKANWKKEIIAAFGEFDESVFSIISYASLVKNGELFNCDLVIADECHYLKNYKAKRTLAFLKALTENKPRRFLGLTGTPIQNRVPEIFTLLRFCSLNPLGTSGRILDMNNWQFANTFAIAKTSFIGGREITKFEGVRNIELLKSYLEGKYIRRADNQTELPEMVRKNVVMDLKESEGESFLLEALKSFESPKMDVLASRKAVLALAKTKSTISYVKDMLEQGEAVVIFSDHVKATLEMAKVFGVVGVTGETKMDDRHKVVEDFQAGKTKVVVATIGALGVGVTLTSARHLVFNDYPWVPADLEQAEKRIHRIGQSRTCFIHYVLSNELDETILKMIRNKNRAISQVI